MKKIFKSVLIVFVISVFIFALVGCGMAEDAASDMMSTSSNNGTLTSTSEPATTESNGNNSNNNTNNSGDDNNGNTNNSGNNNSNSNGSNSDGNMMEDVVGSGNSGM